MGPAMRHTYCTWVRLRPRTENQVHHPEEFPATRHLIDKTDYDCFSEDAAVGGATPTRRIPRSVQEYKQHCQRVWQLYPQHTDE